MNDRKKLCYCCDRVATSVEHVPAKCFFPKASEGAGSYDYRKGLWTVPSCDLHNTSKSKDDEYLMTVLLMSEGINLVGELLIDKVMRNFRSRRGPLRELMKDADDIKYLDRRTKKVVSTSKFKPDIDRVIKSLDLLGRAIYFFEFKRRWLGAVDPKIEFARYDGRSVSNRNIRKFSEEMDSAFSDLEIKSCHKDVFSYQVMDLGELQVAIRAHFFVGLKVTFFLGFDKLNVKNTLLSI